MKLLYRKLINFKYYCKYTLLNTYYNSYLDSETVYSNGYPINNRAEWSGKMISFNSNTDPKVLSNFISKNGYLWIENFFDRSHIYSLEQKSKTYLNLKKASVFKLPTYRAKFHKDIMAMEREQFYLRFSESTQIQKFIEEVFGFEPRIYQRKLIRVKLPNYPFSTGAHYDFNALRKSQDIVYTIWIPIGDIPANAGAITYLADSKEIAKSIEKDIAIEAMNNCQESITSAYNSHFDRDGWITRQLVSLAKTHQKKWLLADFEAGDIVIHDPYIIHASSQNTHEDRLPRISTDIRFQSLSSKPDDRWQNFWDATDGL